MAKRKGWHKERTRHRMAAYKGKSHITGKSDTFKDKMYHAKLAGRRRSASGKVYYEYRRNRADAGKYL